MGYVDPRSFTYDLGAVTRMLGQDRRTPGGAFTSDRWRIAYLTTLIADHGFPAPLPLPGASVGEVRARSRWTRSSVEKWFEDRDPDGTAAADARAARDGAVIMDARAEAIGLRMIDGGRA